MRLIHVILFLLILETLTCTVLAKKSRSKKKNSSSGSGSNERSSKDRKASKGSSNESRVRTKHAHSSGEKSSEEASRTEVKETLSNSITGQGNAKCKDSLNLCRTYNSRGMCKFGTVSRFCRQTCGLCVDKNDGEQSKSIKPSSKTMEINKEQEKTHNNQRSMSRSSEEKIAGKKEQRSKMDYSSKEQRFKQDSSSKEKRSKTLPKFDSSSKETSRTRSRSSEEKIAGKKEQRSKTDYSSKEHRFEKDSSSKEQRLKKDSSSKEQRFKKDSSSKETSRTRSRSSEEKIAGKTEQRSNTVYSSKEHRFRKDSSSKEQHLKKDSSSKEQRFKKDSSSKEKRSENDSSSKEQRFKKDSSSKETSRTARQDQKPLIREHRQTQIEQKVVPYPKLAPFKPEDLKLKPEKKQKDSQRENPKLVFSENQDRTVDHINSPHSEVSEHVHIKPRIHRGHIGDISSISQDKNERQPTDERKEKPAKQVSQLHHDFKSRQEARIKETGHAEALLPKPLPKSENVNFEQQIVEEPQFHLDNQPELVFANPKLETRLSEPSIPGTTANIIREEENTTTREEENTTIHEEENITTREEENTTTREEENIIREEKENETVPDLPETSSKNTDSTVMENDEDYFKTEVFHFASPKPQSLGMKTGVIPDDHITASSSDSGHGPVNSRPDSGGSWRPESTGTPGSYLQIDLGQELPVHGLGTLGDPNTQHRTTSYKVSVSSDGLTFRSLLDRRDNSTERIFNGNVDGTSWVHHCLHRYYGNPPTARYIQFHPIDWHVKPSMRVDAFGYRRHDDPLLIKGLKDDLWTTNVTGCMCYYDNTKMDCACCDSGGCQCPEDNRHQCVQCGYGSQCGVPSLKVVSKSLDSWTKTGSGCACHWDVKDTNCACCQNDGCQCGRLNKNQCVRCGRQDQCGRKENLFGENPYCVPKTCARVDEA